MLGFVGRTIAACSTAELDPEPAGKSRGEATEIGLLEAARALRVDVAVTRREHRRRQLYRFDPEAAPDVDRRRARGRRPDGAREGRAGGGAPALDRDRRRPTADVPLDRADRDEVLEVLERWASQGLRVLAVARRRLEDGSEPPSTPRGRRARALPARAGRAASTRPGRRSPRPSRRCHEAGIRIIVVTGDYGLTAAEIARRVGIASDGRDASSPGAELEAMSDDELDELLRDGRELVFARTLAGGEAAHRRRRFATKGTSSP